MNPVDGLDEYLVSVNAAQQIEPEKQKENEPDE